MVRWVPELEVGEAEVEVYPELRVLRDLRR